MQLFANNADSELNGAITSVSTSITLKTGGGAKFPTPTGGDFFLVTMFQKVGAAELNHEIVKCTARSGDVLTVVRAQEGTTGFAFSNADPVELRFTKGSAENMAQSADLSAHVGTGGAAHANAVAAGAAGFMTGADKTKLDAVSGTNTGDETLATIKTKLGITTLSGSNTGDQTITLTGDVTGSGTGTFAATIAANAVTPAKMAQMASASFLGRTTAGTGNVEVLPAATAKTMLGLNNVTNESKATMFTNAVLTGSTTFPSNGGAFYLEAGTGDGASTTVYNVAVKGHWGIGFRDYQNLSTVKAYIDCRAGIFAGTQLQSLVATGTAPLVVASTTVVPNLNADMVDGYHLERVVAGLRANRNINGGGTITVNGSGSVLWNTRFLVISNGNSAEFSTAGYFDISCPVSGTITGVGGAGNVTATAAGIPLGSCQALYYILPIGSSNASVAANFRVASYNSALSIPSDWVLICVVNGDAPIVYNFPNGIALKVNESLNTTTHDARNADLLDGQQGSYYAANVLTGYSSAPGTVAATDTVLQAIQKLNGNIAAASGNAASSLYLAANFGAL